MSSPRYGYVMLADIDEALTKGLGGGEVSYPERAGVLAVGLLYALHYLEDAGRGEDVARILAQLARPVAMEEVDAE